MKFGRSPKERDNLLALIEVILPLIFDVPRLHGVRRDDDKHHVGRIEPFLYSSTPLYTGLDILGVDPDLDASSFKRSGKFIGKNGISTTVADECPSHCF